MALCICVLVVTSFLYYIFLTGFVYSFIRKPFLLCSHQKDLFRLSLSSQTSAAVVVQYSVLGSS